MKFISKGEWSMGDIHIDRKGLITGEGSVPKPYKSWEEVENAITSSTAFGRFVFSVSDIKKSEHVFPVHDIMSFEFGCRLCGEVFDTAEQLALHEAKCPKWLALKRQAKEEALKEINAVGEDDTARLNSVVPVIESAVNDDEEMEAVKEQAAARKELKEQEAAIKAERKKERDEYTEKIKKGRKKKGA